MGLDVQNFGQVFTPEVVVSQMLSLCRNLNGRVLEPSAGDGAFYAKLPGCTAIELDPRVAPAGALVMDFFDFADNTPYDLVIGNPPYVAFKDILPETKSKLKSNFFDRRSNLYLHFIEKCVRHLRHGGEAVLIVPREFVKLTSARKLNAFLYHEGTITDFIETGDSSIFGQFVPNCAIFRFEKGRMDRRMNDGRIFVERDGQLMFLNSTYPVSLSDLFEVKVGAVSGADDLFEHPEGNMDFVCSKTIDTGQTRRMLFDNKHPHLLKNKTRLLSRKVRDFGEHNWWQWGRLHCIDDRPRIYVNGKTRREKPFFQHSCPNYDGSILALFPKHQDIDLAHAVHLLNQVDWQDLGFVCDGRFLFTQRSLATCFLPDSFRSLLPQKKAA